jgi:hypothetical protein
MNPFKHPEVDSWMIPLAQQYVRDHNPACKISRINVGFEDYELFFNETWSETTVLSGINGQFQPANYPWLVTKHLGHSMPSGAGIMLGVDKPKLFLENECVYNIFYDTMFDWYSHSNLSFEFFYITPDLPELHIKQCHMIINWWAQHMPDIDSETVHKFIYNPMSGHYDNYNLASGRGPAVNINFQGQNGRNKYSSGNHAVFQILQRHARDNNWSSYNHWQENYNWIKSRVPQAFDLDDTFGFKNYESNTTKKILSAARKLRTWKTQT